MGYFAILKNKIYAPARIIYIIRNCQLKSEESLVSLPSIQRGFVCKPNKVETLWDSLLRGYPIGFFVFKDGKVIFNGWAAKSHLHIFRIF
ncbi:MAG: DUF262 domain-containing protein [Chitinophagaceae bacterium]